MLVVGNFGLSLEQSRAQVPSMLPRVTCHAACYHVSRVTIDVTCKCHVSRYTSRVQVSLWAVFAAPFIISTDLRTIRQDTRDPVTTVTRVTLTHDQCDTCDLNTCHV